MKKKTSSKGNFFTIKTYKLNMKRKKETFIQSIVALMMSQVIVKVLGLLYKLYLTNKESFGDEGNAITSAAFQVYSLLLSLTSIGVPGAISKMVAERVSIGDHKGAYKIFKIALALFSIIGMIGSFVLVAFSKKIAIDFLGMPETELSIIALAPSVFLVAVISVYKGYFNGRENMKTTAKAQTYDQLTKTFITIVIIEISAIVSKLSNTEIICGIANLATTLANIVEFGYLYKFYREELNEIKYEIITSVNYIPIRTMKIIKEILYAAIPMSLSPFIGTIGKNMDSTTIMDGLQNTMNYEEAKVQYGIFNGKVDTLINLPLSFSGTISTALIPGIAAAKAKNKLNELEERINLSLLLGLIIALPTAGIYIFFAEEILKLLFPNAAAGGVVLSLSASIVIFISIEQTIRGVLIGVGNNRTPIISTIVGVVFRYILNTILIPINAPFGGINGAAISSTISHFVIMMICYSWLKKEVNVKIRKKNILKLLLAVTVFIFVSNIFIKILNIVINKKIAVVLGLVIGASIYLAIILALKIVNISKIKGLKASKKKR